MKKLWDKDFADDMQLVAARADTGKPLFTSVESYIVWKAQLAGCEWSDPTGHGGANFVRPGDTLGFGAGRRLRGGRRLLQVVVSAASFGRDHAPIGSSKPLKLHPRVQVFA